MPEFFSILTHAGAAKLALAAQTGQPMAISMMAVGDGAGATPTPSPEQTGLIGEQYRAALNALTIVSESANVISAEMIIPPEFGGFWIREVGLYADDGVLVAVGSLPDTYKSHLAEGSGRNSVIRVELTVSSTKDVQLLIDPTVIIATVEYVDTKFREAKNRADDAYALAESKAAFDDIYPPGISIFFATNLNPNEKWPGTTWHYTGENKTIRIGKADGSDVLSEGGSDTVNIARANLPAEEISISGEAEETDLGTKRTKLGGKHAHHGVPKRNSDYELGGNNRIFFDPYQEGDTDEAGEHDHEMELGPHGHVVTGKTEALGQGKAINVVERHIKLMCWYRAA